MAEKLLTIKEAADYLGLSEERVRELISDGIIPAYHIGGTYLRFKKEQLDQVKDKITKDFIAKKFQFEEITTSSKNSPLLEKVKDFIYFYDFYIISAILIFVIIFMIYLSQKR